MKSDLRAKDKNGRRHTFAVNPMGSRGYYAGHQPDGVGIREAKRTVKEFDGIIFHAKNCPGCRNR